MVYDPQVVQALRMRMAEMVTRQRIAYATGHHRNTAGQPLDFENFHFWRQPYADMSTNIVLRCCVQEGKTEWEIVDQLACATVGLRYFAVYPKMELRNTHVGDRIDRVIAMVPEYARQIVNAEGGRDATTLKHFGKGTLRFVSSNVESELISTPADVLGVDEVDSCDLTKMHLAEDRIQRSPFQFTRRVGTPTTPGSAQIQNIDYYYTQSNQQAYHIPCPHCGKAQFLDWYRNVVREVRNDEGVLLDFKIRDTTWTPTGRREPRLYCHYCEKPLNRHAVGSWLALNPSSKLYSGYTLSKLYSPITTLHQLLCKFIEAINNPFAMQRFHNSLLGVPYLGTGDRITDAVLQACANRQPYQTPCETTTQCSMGIDVNGPCFDVWISDYPFLGEGLEAQRCVMAARVKDIKTCHQLIEDFDVSVCVIDSGPEVRLAQEFQDKAACKVWRCRYDTSEGLQVKDLTLDEENGVVTVDRTSSLDLVLQSFLNKEILLPQNYPLLADGELAKHLTSSVRKLEITDKGKQRYVWVGNPDHLLHAKNYDMIAYRLGDFPAAGSSGVSVPVGAPRELGPDITAGAVNRVYQEIRSGASAREVIRQINDRT